MTDRTFAPWHRCDRFAFPAFVAMIWFGVLMGFVPQIIDQLAKGKPYLLIVHAHAFLFVGWLVLLTMQVALIRTGRVHWHKRLGILLVVWAGAMAFVGPATAIASQRAHVGTSEFDPAFLAIQLTDIVGFTVLTAAGLAMRRRPAAHKRLMILGTAYISDAGFARWMFPWVIPAMGGEGPVSLFIAAYGGADAVFVAVGIYDLVTRKRLHPAYVLASGFALLLQLVAFSLYGMPAWKGVAMRLIGL